MHSFESCIHRMRSFSLHNMALNLLRLAGPFHLSSTQHHCPNVVDWYAEWRWNGGRYVCIGSAQARILSKGHLRQVKQSWITPSYLARKRKIYLPKDSG